jgi:hypothetical protein
MGILDEKPQDLECALRETFNHFVSILFSFVAVFVTDLSISLRNDRPFNICLRHAAAGRLLREPVI